MKNTFKFILGLVFGVAIFYYVYAQTVFAFNHPWMTETERFVYSWEALTFQTVPYSTARPRP